MQVELAVENDFKQHLAIQCGSEREIKNRKLYKVKPTSSYSAIVMTIMIMMIVMKRTDRLCECCLDLCDVM